LPQSNEERQQIVAEKRYLGDWEADAIIGQNHKGARLRWQAASLPSHRTFFGYLNSYDESVASPPPMKIFACACMLPLKPSASNRSWFLGTA
jgi:hypothetical protein